MRRIKELLLALPLALALAGTSLAVVTPPSPIDLVVEQVGVAMPDATVVPMWKMRLASDPPGTPLPVISAAAGDTLTINVTNNLIGPNAEPVSLVINGQTATEANAMVPTWTDGTTGPRTGVTQRVRSFTHEAAAGGGTASYTWAGLKAGTYLLQSGTHTGVQVPMGLYGALKVDVAAGQAYGPSTAYVGEAVLLFSEVDPALNNAVADGTYGTDAYPSALNMRYEPKYFLINGAPHTAASTPLPVAGAGQRTLLRLLNAGLRTRVPVLQNEYMQLVADDGNLLPIPTQAYSLELAAGKRLDAIIQPAAAGLLTIHDRAGGVAGGGMIASLGVGQAAPAVEKVGISQAGQWYLDGNGNGIWEAGIDLQVLYGSPTDQPLMGDWDGDGIVTPGVKRGNTYYLRNSNTDGVADVSFVYGSPDDIPLVGDWDGNGIETIGVKRGNTYYLRNSNTDGVADVSFIYGSPDDLPLVGDWDGNSIDTIGIKRGNTYYLRNSNTDGVADVAFVYGLDADVPVIGDWNGDGTDTIGIYRPVAGIFYLRNSNTSGIADLTLNFGLTNGQPFAGNW